VWQVTQGGAAGREEGRRKAPDSPQRPGAWWRTPSPRRRRIGTPDRQGCPGVGKAARQRRPPSALATEGLSIAPSSSTCGLTGGPPPPPSAASGRSPGSPAAQGKIQTALSGLTGLLEIWEGGGMSIESRGTGSQHRSDSPRGVTELPGSSPSSCTQRSGLTAPPLSYCLYKLF
jgi:hypothetical protein